MGLLANHPIASELTRWAPLGVCAIGRDKVDFPPHQLASRQGIHDYPRHLRSTAICLRFGDAPSGVMPSLVFSVESPHQAPQPNP